LILTDQGLYGCGDNSYGQLLLNDYKYTLFTPIINHILSIDCGDFHTMIQTIDGYYLCGLNLNGQLGIKNCDYSLQLVKINRPDIINVQCGPLYTVINCMSGVYIYCDHKIKKIVNQPFDTIFCSFYYLTFLKNNVLYTYGKNHLPKLNNQVDYLTQINIKDVIHIDGHRDYIIIFTKFKMYFIGDSPHLRRYRNMFDCKTINLLSN
jgi:hypothetical protein